MKKWSILVLACAFCATIFSCTNQAESEEEMGKMYVAENDFIRVEFHSRTNAEGSLNDCIGGGGEFFYNYECECTDSQEQCGTLVIIPKIPVYTISIDYWYDELIDYSYKSEIYKSEIYWERVGMKRWRNCTYLIDRDIFIMGNADKLELHFFSPKPEAFSTLEDPESPDEGLGEVEHHFHSANFLLTKISVEPLEKSAVTYTDLNGRAHHLADCKGFQSPIYYTALNGQIKSIAVIPQAHPMASPVRIAQCQNGGSIANLGWKILERFPYLFQNDILTLLRYD